VPRRLLLLAETIAHTIHATVLKHECEKSPPSPHHAAHHAALPTTLPTLPLPPDPLHSPTEHVCVDGTQDCNTTSTYCAVVASIANTPAGARLAAAALAAPLQPTSCTSHHRIAHHSSAHTSAHTPTHTYLYAHHPPLQCALALLLNDAAGEATASCTALGGSIECICECPDYLSHPSTLYPQP
jgi:hypothetical protein